MHKKNILNPTCASHIPDHLCVELITIGQNRYNLSTQKGGEYTGKLRKSIYNFLKERANKVLSDS